MAREYSAEEIDQALVAFCFEGGRQKQTMAVLRKAGLKVPWGTLTTWAYDTQRDRYEQIRHEVEPLIQANLADAAHRLARMGVELSEETLGRIKATLERHDDELKEVDDRLAGAKEELDELDKGLRVARRRLAESSSLDTVEALIEDILDEDSPGVDADLLAAVRAAGKRRESVVEEIDKLWRRRDSLEVGFKDLAKLLHEGVVLTGISVDKRQILTGQATERVEHNFPELQRALEAKGIRLAVGQGAPRPLPAPVRELPVPVDD